MNISSNISAIQTDQRLLGDTAHKIANVNTTQSAPSETPQRTADEVSKSTRPDPSQVDLTKAMTDQLSLAADVEVNATAMRTQDETLGTLLDIKV